MVRLFLVATAALLLIAASAICARADVTIHVEDFEDENGDAGFDPLFNHSIILLRDDGRGVIFDGVQLNRPGDILLDLYYAQDTVNFNIPENRIIVAASIEIVFPGIMTCCFVGTEGEKLLESPDPVDSPLIFCANQEEIGDITSLWIQGINSIFNNITIEVIEVPELSAFCNLTLIGLLCGIVHVRKYGKAFLNHEQKNEVCRRTWFIVRYLHYCVPRSLP